MESEAIIIGAGPVGCAVAIGLARRGRRSTLIDGACFPREKICGEGIMPHGVVALAELGLREAVEEAGRAYYGIRYTVPGAESAEACFPGFTDWTGRGLAVRRLHLDAILIEAVRAEPLIDLRLGRYVQDLTLPKDGKPAEVRLGEETLRAPVLIAADGASSLVRRRAGLEGELPSQPRFAIRGHFERGVGGDRPVVEVVLGEIGELYLTPVTEGSTGVILTIEQHQLPLVQGHLEESLRSALRACGGTCATLADAPLASRVRAIGPLARGARETHAEGLLLVGDAGGALDPITGEGISLGLRTAAIAAETIDLALSAGDLSAERLAGYSLKRRRMVRDLKAMTAFVLWLMRRPRLASYVVRNLSRHPETLSRLLGIAAGDAPLSSVSLRDGLRIVTGV